MRLRLGEKKGIHTIICFWVFLYNMEIRKTAPVVACEKIKCATDQRFSCYDREEEAIGLANYISTGYIDEIYKKICSDDADEEKE